MGLLLFGLLTGQSEYVDAVASTYKNALWKHNITESGFRLRSVRLTSNTLGILTKRKCAEGWGAGESAAMPTAKAASIFATTRDSTQAIQQAYLLFRRIVFDHVRTHI